MRPLSLAFALACGAVFVDAAGCNALAGISELTDGPPAGPMAAGGAAGAGGGAAGTQAQGGACALDAMPTDPCGMCEASSCCTPLADCQDKTMGGSARCTTTASCVATCQGKADCVAMCATATDLGSAKDLVACVTKSCQMSCTNAAGAGAMGGTGGTDAGAAGANTGGAAGTAAGTGGSGGTGAASSGSAGASGAPAGGMAGTGDSAGGAGGMTCSVTTALPSSACESCLDADTDCSADYPACSGDTNCLEILACMFCCGSPDVPGSSACTQSCGTPGGPSFGHAASVYMCGGKLCGMDCFPMPQGAAGGPGG